MESKIIKVIEKLKTADAIVIGAGAGLSSAAKPKEIADRAVYLDNDIADVIARIKEGV